ncbi:MAG TPA: LytTR family transcriptional regulator [Bacteroidetes bacterium]|nr:LytTR family transcriptional regulator [Bacteroidota bacterium]
MEQMPLKWIALPQNGGYVLSDVKDILYCESDGNYSTVYMQDGSRHLACRKLKEMEARLPKECFVRIHHGYLVNLFHVKKYHRGDGGQVELSNGLRLDVSRRKKQAFLERLIVV